MTRKERKRKKKEQMKNKRLIKKYYWLRPLSAWTGKPLEDYDYTFIEWGWCPGWDKAFGQMFMDELGAAIKESGQKDYQIVQIKEKYGCYDSETEVLTKNGWKYFKDLSYEDEIATLNPNTNYLEYQKPKEIIAEKYNGKMYRLENRGISLCVTPNHNLYIAKGSYFNGSKKNYKRYYDFELCTPDKYFRKDKRFLKTCKWDGELNNEVYKIKGIEYDALFDQKKPDGYIRHYIKEDLQFNIIPWLRFLGFYIAEGCVADKKNKERHYDISVAFNPYDESELVLELIRGIGYEPNIDYERGCARFCDITLGEWLFNNCGHGAINKRVPEFIKNLPPKYITEFLKYLFIGDGHKTTTYNILTTTSKQLSNDVQELLLKAGYCFRETQRDRRGKLGGYAKDHHPIISKHITYEINWLQLPDIEIDMSKAKKTKSFIEDWVNYSGHVYCVTVPNHIIYVRRNGKGLWCGNSMRLYDNGSSQKVHDIIRKYEVISQHVCMDCGREAPTIDDGWISVMCFDCFKKYYRRRERCYNDEPITDEEIKELYGKYVRDEMDDNGKHHIPNSYKYRMFKGDDMVTVEVDISDTVNKIRKRISKFGRY